MTFLIQQRPLCVSSNPTLEATQISVAVREINASTPLNVQYDKITRKGRKITDSQWHIEEKDTSKAIGNAYITSKRDFKPRENDFRNLYAMQKPIKRLYEHSMDNTSMNP